MIIKVLIIRILIIRVYIIIIILIIRLFILVSVNHLIYILNYHFNRLDLNWLLQQRLLRYFLPLHLFQHRHNCLLMHLLHHYFLLYPHHINQLIIFFIRVTKLFIPLKLSLSYSFIILIFFIMTPTSPLTLVTAETLDHSL